MVWESENQCPIHKKMLIISQRAGLEREAFSLLESLLVLALLSLLTLLVYPTISRMWDAGRMSKSMANLRTICQGLNLYIVEHNGCFPEGAIDSRVHGEKARYWFNALAYYIDEERDLKAAGTRAERPSWQNCPGRPMQPERLGEYGVSVGYGWNHQFFGYSGSSTYIDRYGWHSRLSEVELPSKTIIIGTNREKDSAGNPIKANSEENVCIYGNRPDSRRFNGAGLYLFVDGHIERLTPEEASVGKSDGLPADRYLFKKRKDSVYPEDNRTP